MKLILIALVILFPLMKSSLIFEVPDHAEKFKMCDVKVKTVSIVFQFKKDIVGQ